MKTLMMKMIMKKEFLYFLNKALMNRKGKQGFLFGIYLFYAAIEVPAYVCFFMSLYFSNKHPIIIGHRQFYRVLNLFIAVIDKLQLGHFTYIFFVNSIVDFPEKSLTEDSAENNVTSLDPVLHNYGTKFELLRD